MEHNTTVFFSHKQERNLLKPLLVPQQEQTLFLLVSCTIFKSMTSLNTHSNGTRNCHLSQSWLLLTKNKKKVQIDIIRDSFFLFKNMIHDNYAKSLIPRSRQTEKFWLITVRQSLFHGSQKIQYNLQWPPKKN